MGPIASATALAARCPKTASGTVATSTRTKSARAPGTRITPIAYTAINAARRAITPFRTVLPSGRVLKCRYRPSGISTRATRLSPLSAIARFPVFVGIMFSTNFAPLYLLCQPTPMETPRDGVYCTFEGVLW